MTMRRLAGASWAGLILAFYYRRAWRLLLAGPAAWRGLAVVEGGWRLPWAWAGQAIWRSAAALGGAVAILFTAWGLGLLLLRLLRCRPDNALDTLLFRLAAGLGALSYLSLGLAAVGWYRPMVVAPLVVVFAVLGSSLAISGLARAWRRWRHSRAPGDPAGCGVIGSVLVIAIGIALVGALAPEREYDALWYHLWLPRLWLEHGRPVDVVSEYVSLYPLTWELLYGDAMTLGGVVAAKLLHFACFPLLAAACWQLTRRLCKGVSPWLAGAVVVTAPTVLWEATTAYIDLALAVYVTLGLYALLMHMQQRETRAGGWYRLAVLCLGLAAAIKHLGLIVAVLAASELLLAALVSSGLSIRVPASLSRTGTNTRNYLVQAVALVAVVLAIASPWYWRAWSASGNPFFPELFSVFGARPPERWDAITDAGLAGFKAHFGFGHSLRSTMLLPWAVTQHAASFGGSIGPFFLLAAPWVAGALLSGLKPRASAEADPAAAETTAAASATPAWGAPHWLACLVLGYVAVWASPLGSLQLRFLVPIVPAMSVLAALGLTRFVKRFAWILAALLVLNLPPFTALHEGDREPWNTWLTHVVRTIPFGVVTGRESGDIYLRRNVATYGAWRQLAGRTSAVPLLVLEAGGGDNLYATQPKVPIDATLARGGWAEGPGADEIVSETLVRLGVTHVLLDKGWLAKMAAEGAALASPAYRQAHLVLEYEDTHSLLYRAAPTTSNATQRSFLPH